MILRIALLILVWIIGAIILSVFVSVWIGVGFFIGYPIILVIFRKPVIDFIIPDYVDIGIRVGKYVFNNKGHIKTGVEKITDTFKKKDVVSEVEKYYIPTIHEFHEGFEYEMYIAGSGDDYEKKVFSLYDQIQVNFIRNCYTNNLTEGWLRVHKKYLLKN